MTAPLTAHELAEIDRALCALGALASPPAMRWALAASWALSDEQTLHCLVTTTHFVACGGGGWARLGYDAGTLASAPWPHYLASAADVARSHDVVGDNVESGRGVDAFENFYRHAITGDAVRVRWRISPWRDGYAVARGVVCDG